MGAVSLACGILGEHLETIILQLMLIISYFIFRVLSIYRNSRINSDQLTVTVSNYNLKRIISWSLVAFICAIGLTAFFILPAYDFMQNNHLEHDCAVLTSIDLACEPIGPNYYDPIILSSNFIPYILGQLHAYWLVVTPGFVGFWGYVGTLGLFFSILGLLTISKKDNPHRFIPLFFIGISVFFILKTVGTPLINSIGYLPILNLVSFTGYLGAIIPIGFAVAASFGVEYIGKFNVKKITIFKVFLITITILFLLLIPIIPYLSDDADFPSHVNPSDARNYFVLQVLQSIIFVVLAFITYTFSAGKNFTKTALISLVFLELSLYIPLGLHPIWIAYKAAIIIAAMVSITILSTSKRIQIVEVNQKNIKLIILILIFIFTFIGVVLISYLSPYGMMERTDPYQDNPVTDFLKENLGDSRMFSFDYALGPSYPAGYEISTMGILGAMTIDSFETYYFNFLDADALTDTLAFFSYDYGPNLAKEKFLMNKKYFDFLGLKYIVTEGYDFNTITFGTPGLFVQHDRTENLGGLVTVTDNKNSVGQSFISPVNSINSIGISFMASNHLPGTVYLDIDSIPYDKKFHRESSISKINEREFASFVFDHPIKDVENVELHMVLYYTPKSSLDHVSVVTFSTANPDFDRLKELNGKFYQNDQVVKNTQMVFSIESEQSQRDVVLPVVFKHENIRISENSDAFPRAFLVNEYHIQLPNYKKPFIKDMENCLHIPTCLGTAQMYILENPKFDLSSEIVIEESLPIEQAKELENSKIDENSSVEIISYESERVIIKSKNSTSAFLVLTDSFYPGWDAYIDGDETKIYRADGVVRAVYVPAGEHTIEFSYMPNSLLIGLFISLISAICLGFVLIKKF